MCHYLVVRCLLEAKELTEAVQVINEFETLTNINQSETSFDDHSIVIDDAPKNVGTIYLIIILSKNLLFMH
jgi:anaphase-promoting complex subunit 6